MLAGAPNGDGDCVAPKAPGLGDAPNAGAVFPPKRLEELAKEKAGVETPPPPNGEGAGEAPNAPPAGAAPKAGVIAGAPNAGVELAPPKLNAGAEGAPNAGVEDGLNENAI